MKEKNMQCQKTIYPALVNKLLGYFLQKTQRHEKNKNKERDRKKEYAVHCLPGEF